MLIFCSFSVHTTLKYWLYVQIIHVLVVAHCQVHHRKYFTSFSYFIKIYKKHTYIVKKTNIFQSISDFKTRFLLTIKRILISKETLKVLLNIQLFHYSINSSITKAANLLLFKKFKRQTTLMQETRISFSIFYVFSQKIWEIYTTL